MKIRLIATIVIIIFFINLGKFLDTTSKAKKSDVIFSLGGYGNERVIKSLNLLQNDYSKSNTLYLSAKEHLKNIDQKSYNIKYVSYLQNTMAEILYIQYLIEKHHYDSVLIVTDPPHSRRVDFMIKEFIPEINGKYMIVSSDAQWWKTSSYFMNSHAFFFSLSEMLKIFYNYLKYTYKSIFNEEYQIEFREIIDANEK
ncbi:MAG: hypothetical protein JXQ67_05840 [Campylobacterales bacterium]|nr:hypothetical protein [Campylobacterales bacterium]